MDCGFRVIAKDTKMAKNLFCMLLENMPDAYTREDYGITFGFSPGLLEWILESEELEIDENSFHPKNKKSYI